MILKSIFVLSILLAVTDAARILAVLPAIMKSRFAYNEAILKTLHAAGHHVTVISPFPSTTKIDNYTMIDSRSESFAHENPSSVQHVSKLGTYDILNLATQLGEKCCNDVLKLKAIQDALNSKTKLYDVMFIEIFQMYQCYLPIAQKLGIPVIATLMQRASTLADAAIGVPNNPAVIPTEFTDSKTKMTFSQRLENTWNYLLSELFYSIVITPKIDSFYQTYFPDPELQYKKKISMIFYNNHASLLPRPLTPNAIDIGGIHVKPAKVLPKDLQKFIDEAEHGVILFTFGSIIKASTLSKELRSAFVKAFAAIPQRVIWKYEDYTIEGLSNNVLLSNWVPQRDILEHKNVRAFISHCGTSGTYEAVHTGTPLIMTPFFFDQKSNAALLEELGVGIRLNLETITTEKLLEAINQIFYDTRYQERMTNLAEAFKDRPITPQNSVVYWTDYVIRHDGALHLRTSGADMPLYQYLLIDVILFLTVIIAAVLLVTYLVLKRIYSMFSKISRPFRSVEKGKKTE